jgi:general secretion pathway protein C
VIRTIVIERWALFRRWLPTDVYLWLKALLLAAIALQAARLVWIIVTPVGPLGDWRPAPARTLPGQAQAAVIAAVDPFSRSSGPSTGALPALDLRLFGTREDQGAGGGSAILGPQDGEQKSYVVGEEIVPGVKLAAVFFDHVLLDRGGGRQEELRIDQGQPAVSPPAASGGSAPQGGSQTAGAIQQAVSFAPRLQGGRVTGVTVGPGSNPALFASAGFLPGDVITAVNGARITSQTDVVQLQSSITPGARLSLTVERGAETVPVALNLAGN